MGIEKMPTEQVPLDFDGPDKPTPAGLSAEAVTVSTPSETPLYSHEQLRATGKPELVALANNLPDAQLPDVLNILVGQDVADRTQSRAQLLADITDWEKIRAKTRLQNQEDDRLARKRNRGEY